MAKKNPSKNRQARRALASVAAKLPEPPSGPVVKAKIKQLVLAPNGVMIGLGADNRVYVWDAYFGGWKANILTQEEKDALKVQIAAHHAANTKPKEAPTKGVEPGEAAKQDNSKIAALQ